MKDISKSGASRNKVDKHRFDLLVWEFIDEMARVMAEGAVSHGEPGDDGHWQGGFDDEQKDIWNHVWEHHRRYREGDKSEPHLAKMAVGAMFQWYFDEERRNDVNERQNINAEIPSSIETPECFREAGRGRPPVLQDGTDHGGCDPQGNCGTQNWDEGDPQYVIANSRPKFSMYDKNGMYTTEVDKDNS
jgi:hypothetical protein